MASFNPILANNDLKVVMIGSHLSKPAQFSVRIENTKDLLDTANVTVSIIMRQLLRGGVVQTIKQHQRTPCNWSIIKEIRHSWEFDVAGRRFTRGLFILEVTITGRSDDLYFYRTVRTYGIIVSPFRVLMVPHR
jgi:hypothetical protein